jgi:hypothetical protein
MSAYTPAPEHGHTCQGCGQPVRCRAANHRRWCREACRVAAFRRDHPRLPELLVCRCGATYTYARGRGKRPHKCPECRAAVHLRRALAILDEAAHVREGGHDARVG